MAKFTAAPVAPAARRKSTYNPRPIRRQVRRAGAAPDGVQMFTAKSFTRDDGTRHAVEIDLHTGACRCACENFTYRRAQFNPTLHAPHLWCKHIERAIEGMERRGELEVTRDGLGVMYATPTGAPAGGYSFDEPLTVDAPASGGWDAEHDRYLDELAQRMEAEYEARHCA